MKAQAAADDFIDQYDEKGGRRGRVFEILAFFKQILRHDYEESRKSEKTNYEMMQGYSNLALLFGQIQS